MKIFTFLVAFTVSTLIYAQLPQNFSYQAVVRGANNALLSNQIVGIKISLLKGTENGQSVYSEVHTATTNANGLVSIAVGGGTFLEGNFIKIDWANGPYFVKTEIDPQGGTNYSLVTTTQLLSVPYALYAANSQPGPKGDKGEKGDQGTPGKDGKEEFQQLRVSATGDTLYLTNGNFVIVPGLSSSNDTISSYGPKLFDVEGNEYKTVKIGNQLWMAENLRTSSFNDGVTIPNVFADNNWNNLKSAAWCSYNNDEKFEIIYGKLYNWYALSPKTNGNKNICPVGWHVPRDKEWLTLYEYLGGVEVAANKLKHADPYCWMYLNEEASNSSKFSGLPGGFFNREGNFDGLFSVCMWWSSTENDVTSVWRFLVHAGASQIDMKYFPKEDAASIRCVKDL